METRKQTHVAILTSPGMGHIIPSLELGKSLVSQHDLKVTLFIPTTSKSPQASTLQNNQDGPNVINLPPVDITHLVSGETSLVVRITTIVRESLASLRSIIETSQQIPTVLIIDLFSTDALDIADEFKMSKYMFCTSNMSAYAFLAYLPRIKRVKNNNDLVSRLAELVHVPGCKPIRAGLLADPNTGSYGCMLRHATRFEELSGVLLNTFEDLEQETYRALIDDEIAKLIPTPTVYPVGPIIKPTVGPSQNQAIHCLSWLDNQPNGSVLFVSLLNSQQRFIWVVRNPIDFVLPSSYYLDAGNTKEIDPSDFLPDGFLARTQQVGLVLPNWAPQVEILSHASVGCFLSHCGWNSTLESILNGVPMIPWPLFADQHLNATLLSDDIKVAARTQIPPGKEVIRREEIERMIRLVMEEGDEEGKNLRRRAKELKTSALRAISIGGSSYNSLCQLVEKWNTESDSVQL
ncbi:hypothetical protein MKX03_005984 [Papaver bracteatum]|nr:hypothetical protein MKX03_005984 [Papaver bracteatum]